MGTDTKRLHIDEEIHQVEIALNKHGVATSLSCIGHNKEAPPFPYVVISSQKVIEQLLPACLIVMVERPLSSVAMELHRAIAEINSELGQNLLQLLNGFYLEHAPMSIRERLVIQASGLDRYKLLNQGSIVRLYPSTEDGYLEEFVSFANYLNTVV